MKKLTNVIYISSDEANTIIGKNKQLINGGVTSTCWIDNQFFFKLTKEHHSKKYKTVLPSSRAINEWTVLSIFKKDKVRNVPILDGIYHSKKNNIYLSRMRFIDGEILPKLIFKGEFNSKKIGKKVGEFLKLFHQKDISSEDITPVWTIKNILLDKMDYLQYCQLVGKSFDNLINDSSNYTLNWGDASLKNIIQTKSKKIILIDFDQCFYAPAEFDIGYCLGHVDLYRICNYYGLKEVEFFLWEMKKKYNSILDFEKVKFFWGLTLFYRRDGYAVDGIIEKNKKNEIIQKSIDILYTKLF